MSHIFSQLCSTTFVNLIVALEVMSTKHESVRFPKILFGIFNFFGNMKMKNFRKKGRFGTYGNTGYTNLKGRGFQKQRRILKEMRGVRLKKAAKVNGNKKKKQVVG